MAVNRSARTAVALALAAPWAIAVLAADKAADKDGDKGAEPESPYEPACEYCADYRGTHGWVELGGFDQNEVSYRFARYSDLGDDGTTLNGGGEFLHRGDGGVYYRGSASDLGLDSRDARLEGGKQGKYSISVQYDQTPFHENDATSTPYRDDLGSNHFRLPFPWQDGLTTQDMTLLPFTRKPVDLETERKKGAAEFSYIPMEHWEVTARYARENKDGRNDQGATFGFDNTVILPVPIDYQTDDYDLALHYTGKRLQAKVAYHGSGFDDGYNSVTWRNPFAEVTDFRAFGRMSTPPDNQVNQVSATVGYDLLPHTRLTGQLALGRMTQDDDLLPYTTNPYIPVGGLTIAALNAGVVPPATRIWQRLIAPDSGDLNAEVDTTLAKLQVNSRPTPKLRLNGSYTYSDRDNQTEQLLRYYAVTDLARSSNPRVNLPYSFTQQLTRASAGYKLPLRSDVEIGVDYDVVDRTYQEVDQTTETTGWAKFKIKPIDMVELGLDYAHAARDGSDYMRVWQVFPPQNRLQRLSYLNGRDRDKWSASVAVTPLESLTLSGRIERTDDSYDGDRNLGLREAETQGYTLDASFSPIEHLSTHAYYTWEQLTSLQAGGQNQLFPEWTASDENETDVIGIGAEWTGIKGKLDLSADAIWTNYRGNTDFTQYWLPALGYPDQSYDMVRVELKAKYKINDKFSVGLGYRHERYDEAQDWASEGLMGLPSVLGLRAAGQQDYDVDLFLANLRYAF